MTVTLDHEALLIAVKNFLADNAGLPCDGEMTRDEQVIILGLVDFYLGETVERVPDGHERYVLRNDEGDVAIIENNANGEGFSAYAPEQKRPERPAFGDHHPNQWRAELEAVYQTKLRPEEE